MRRVLTLVLAGSFACGRSFVYEPAGGDVGTKPAPAPCRGDGGTSRLSQTRDGVAGNTVTWPRGDCIELTYSKQLESSRPLFIATFDAWSAPECTWMCFSEPHVADDPTNVPFGRRIHIRPKGITHPDPFIGLTNVTYDRMGNIVSVEIVISEDRLVDLGDYLQLAGQALGFSRTPGVESVINNRFMVTPKRFTLSSADVDSLCAVYPACR